MVESYKPDKVHILKRKKENPVGDTYSLAVPVDKKTYYLGSISSAIRCLPLLLEEKCIDKEVILFHDGGFMSDRYEGSNDLWGAGSEEFKGEIYDGYPTSKGDWVEENMLDKDEFYNLENQCTTITTLIYLGNKNFKLKTL